MKEKSVKRKEEVKKEDKPNFGAFGAIIFLILWIPIIYGLVKIDNHLNNRRSMAEERSNPCIKYKYLFHPGPSGSTERICIKRVSDLKFEKFPSIEGPTIKASPKQNTISLIR